MFKKITFIFLLSVMFNSCVFFVTDTSRAIHPIMSDTSSLVYVKMVSSGNAVNTYRTGLGAMPTWCDINEKYANFLLDNSLSKKMFAVCYSNKRPLLQEDQILPKNTFPQSGEQGKGLFSVEEFFNPFSRAYLFSISVAPSKYDDFFIFYFDMYRKFCQKDGISCCMTGNGNDFKFSMVVEEPENVRQFYMEIDSVVTYMNSSHEEYQNVVALYGLFSATIYDKCRFNRWYYDAIAAGVISPESFIDLEKWKQLEGRTTWARIKRIDVKLIDYQKISLEDKKWLENSLKDLGERF